MTDITPDERLKDDIRPIEVFLAMGGFWLLLGVIGWMALIN